MLCKSGWMPGIALLLALPLVGCNSKTTPSAAEIQSAKQEAMSKAASGNGQSGSGSKFETAGPANISRDPSNLDNRPSGLPPIGNIDD